MVMRLSIVLVEDVRGYVGGQGVGRRHVGGGKELGGKQRHERAVQGNAGQYYD